MHNYLCCVFCFFFDTDSTNYLQIAGRSIYNASDYINASILVVSPHVINSIKILAIWVYILSHNYSHPERMYIIYNNLMCDLVYIIVLRLVAASDVNYNVLHAC